MQTVNFQCGHCHNLMAVGADHLGQQVRCPHCGQVVVAPPPAGESPLHDLAPEPATAPQRSPFAPLNTGDHEDIFSHPPADDLFGGNEGPKLELPPAAPSPVFVPPPPPTWPEPPALPPPAWGDEAEQDQASVAPEPIPATADFTASGSEGPALAEAEGPTAPADDGLPGGESPVGPRGRRSRSGSQGALGTLMLVLLVIIPLLIYAVMATVAAVILYVRQQAGEPPLFKMLPDVQGDSPGVVRPKPASTFRLTLEQAIGRLPDDLIVPLGKSLVLGDLEVTPRRVEQRKIRLHSARGGDPEPSPNLALVLVLGFRNRSDRWAFAPLDNYFDRQWKPKAGGMPVLTQLEAGKSRFFGGPAKWFPLRGKEAPDREWLEGRTNVDLDGLQPHQEMESVVATDGWDPETAAYLFGEGGKPGYRGKLLWRVHLRRGVASYRGRDVMVTSVIGVPFSEADYRQKEG